jgi:nitrogen fixation protein NifB
LMSVDRALEALEKSLTSYSSLKIVAVSGPGEPLANLQTLELLTEVRRLHPELRICLSTNGTLLEGAVDDLVDLGVETVSVSFSAVRPRTAASIYEWAVLNGSRLSGLRMGERIVETQLAGIRRASDSGVVVKVNSILIPRLNAEEMHLVAEAVSNAGAAIQNIVPLVPADRMLRERPPRSQEIEAARSRCAKYIDQFHHCQQCRSDVVGIPGADTIL